MTPYEHLPGYLHRWKLLGLKNFMIRVHEILTADGTPFLHNHPFHYVSIVLSGWYEEQLLVGEELVVKRHGAGSLILRSRNQYHRISSVGRNTKTLFLSYKVKGGWGLKRHRMVKTPANYLDMPNGVYEMSDGKFRLRLEGVWCLPRDTLEEARSCRIPSIHQTGDKVAVKG
jgi:hypothetical protein